MILFLFIIGYGVCFTLSEIFSNLIGITHVITAFTILIYAVALIVYLLRQRKKRYLFGFNIRIKPIDCLYFLPLLILPAVNIILLDNLFDPFTIILFMGVCVIEEIFFRNFLFFALNQRFSLILSIILSSVIFALFHAVNLLNSFDILFVSLQIVSSFAVGVCFSALAIKFKSLLPSAVAHFLINLTGMGVISTQKWVWAVLIGASSIIYLVYGLGLLTNYKKNTYR